MTHKMIIGLFCNFAAQFFLPDLLADEKATTFFLWMFARHDFFVSLLEQVACERRASIQFERFRREMFLQKFLAGYLFFFLFRFAVVRVKLPLQFGVKRAGASERFQLLADLCQ